MPQIKHYISAFFLCLGLISFAQNSIDDDPEIIQNRIDYHLQESEKDIENFDYFEAQKELDEALKLATEANNEERLGIIYATIGKLQLTVEEADKAIKSITQAIRVQRLNNDNINLGESYKIFGDIYLKKKEYKLALEQYRAAKSKFEEEDLNEKLAEILFHEGLTYMELKNLKNARIHLDQSLNLSKKLNLTRLQSKALVNLSKVYLDSGLVQRASTLVNESLKLAKQNDYISILNDCYLVLSDISSKQNDFKMSYDYLKSHLKLSDSLQAIQHENLSPEKRIEYLMADKAEELKKANKDKEEAESKNDLGTLISILSVALITILSLLTLSLYKNNNIRLKTNNMLHKKNSELIIAKEKAELASKTKANFLSTVTHELRTPLYAVTGLSNMLLDEDPKPEQIQHLKSLKFSGDYLLTFINDILQLNKIEANKVNIEPEPFNLKSKINNIVMALNNSALDNNIKIHFEYPKDLPENFIADQIKISQILINLIGNSIKFTKDGDIWIRVHKIEQDNNNYTLRFEVEDNGIGISKEKQDHMFESFSQGSIQINRKYGGTGLGLSIVKGLIEILKGKIYLTSELGKGTTFYFEIPLEYTDQGEIKETKQSYFTKDTNEIDLTKVKILVVEDNKINQMITKKILTKMNLNCDIVDNGEDAVDKIKTNSYDIVLMDIHMPGISGIEATKIVRTFDKELTIFALTAVTIEDRMQEFDEAGFTDIIPKPFKQEEFEKKLFNALNKKKKSA
ncbi:tetratricopeptide repeat-containing hybrid sensor histidine kinase/response regulator [Aestuariivivens insulae]|uniref:tetratricopeptide repeat-containing hybrid sensor histidine kinase/response regulator n=1 Tax=Aestuariivivens insulae TaxID=1621988 RepID=UPI001F55CD14|nr:ATP-binding protein [Aestuariivivens insulae]